MQVASLLEMLARARQECRGLLRRELSASGWAVFQGRAAVLNRMRVKLSLLRPRCVEWADVRTAFRALHLLPPLAEVPEIQREARP
jgi:hypothetical protein